MKETYVRVWEGKVTSMWDGLCLDGVTLEEIADIIRERSEGQEVKITIET